MVKRNSRCNLFIFCQIPTPNFKQFYVSMQVSSEVTEIGCVVISECPKPLKYKQKKRTKEKMWSESQSLFKSISETLQELPEPMFEGNMNMFKLILNQLREGKIIHIVEGTIIFF